MSGAPGGSEPLTTVSIVAGPLVGPVLRRVVGMLAARADLPLDRLDDAVLVADLIAARAPAHVAEGRVDVALEPVSRSGGTITMGLFLGYSRAAAARYSFLLAVPAVLGSGFFQAYEALTGDVEGRGVSWGPTILATVIAFGVGLTVIACLFSHNQLYTPADDASGFHSEAERKGFAAFAAKAA